MIKRQALSLDKQRGHIFSVLIQGLQAFDRDSSVKDAAPTPKRANINFEILVEPQSEAFKLIGRWFEVATLEYGGHPPSTIGPIIPIADYRTLS